MAKTGRPPSMVDVAKHAGVSHQTVSRVLNTPDAVRADTRERVERSMRELSYRRNSQARALKTRRTGLIGVVSQGYADFGPTQLTLSIEGAARDRGYATALSVVRDACPQTVEATLDFFLSHGVEGIIVLTPVPGLIEAAEQLAAKTPVVVLTSGLESEGELRVAGIDHAHGAELATRHLVEQGRRRIAHISGPMTWFDAQGRVEGWRRSLQEAGMDDSRMAEAEDWTAEAGFAAMEELCAAEALPDAVFASNDFIALGAIRALEQRGVEVPRDVSVVGYDDVDGAAFFHPPLTTVAQPFREAGRAALTLLLDQAESAAGRERVFLEPHLVVRES